VHIDTMFVDMHEREASDPVEMMVGHNLYVRPFPLFLTI
jgi:hypothetical protein